MSRMLEPPFLCTCRSTTIAHRLGGVICHGGSELFQRRGNAGTCSLSWPHGRMRLFGSPGRQPQSSPDLFGPPRPKRPPILPPRPAPPP
eukprot:5132725-Prymnesium_polylepis.1